MKNENILFVTHTLQVGGAAKMMKYAAHIAQQCFSSVGLVAITDNDLQEDTDSFDECYALACTPRPRVLWQVAAVWRLRQLLKRTKAKYICTFVTKVAFMTRLASLGLDKVIISAERGDPYVFSPIWKFLAKWTFSRSDYAVFQLPNAQKFYGDEVVKKSFVIPNPFIPSCEPLASTSPRTKTIVSAGRFVPEKLYHVLIAAFANVHKIHNDYKLVIYGEGECLAQYKKLSGKLGIQEAVEFPGYVNNVAYAMRNASVFVLSSQYEGIPNSLLEAMSVGLPCVATDCSPGGPAMLIGNDENGILVPVNDTLGMTKAILSIIEDSDRARVLSEKALTVCEMLNESKISRMWVGAYNVIKSK